MSLITDEDDPLEVFFMLVVLVVAVGAAWWAR